MRFHHHLCTLLCACATCIAYAPDEPGTGSGSMPEAPYRWFSTRTPYSQVRGDVSSLEHVTGCHAKQVYMLVRHGTRYPAREEVKLMNKFLPVITHYILSPNSTGCLSQRQKDSVQSWKSPFHPDDDLKIAEQGLNEMYDLAERMRRRFPHLMTISKEDIPKINIRYTDNNRSFHSAAYFLHGLMHRNLSHCQWVNFHNLQGSKPKSEDLLLLYCDICYKYIRQRLYPHETEREETEKFDNGKVLQRAADDVTMQLGLPPGFMNLTVMRGLYEACRYGYAIFNDSTWCDVLPVRMLKALEYRQDMRYYWRYGHGKAVNYEPSCTLLQDLWENFRKIMTGKQKKDRVVLRFGHSRSILPFLVRLGYFNDSTALLAENFHLHEKRHWRLAKINPFSSNIAFALYHCQDGQYRVQILINERQVSPPVCNGGLCTLRDLEEAWQPILDSCNFRKICDQDRDKQNILLNESMFHHA